MQHVKKEIIDKFIDELEGIMTSTVSVKADATKTDLPEYSLAGTKVASGMKPYLVVTTAVEVNINKKKGCKKMRYSCAMRQRFRGNRNIGQ